MERLPIEELQPGMYVNGVDGLPGLVVRPGKVDKGDIERLCSKGVRTVYVVRSYEVDLESFSDEIKASGKAMNKVKMAFSGVAHTLKINNHVPMEKVGEMCDLLLDEVETRSEIVLNTLRLRDKDNYTYEHSVRVGVYSIIMARILGMNRSEQADFGTAGLLHDIGKLVIPKRLIKKKGSLSPQEFEVMRLHPTAAEELLSRTPNMTKKIVAGVAQHHERMDGNGYPKGLRGDRISLLGKCLGIVDTYDAMTSDRPYRKAKTSWSAFSEMRTHYLHAYDPELMDRFIKEVGIFAPGTYVKLADGQSATVVGNNRNALLKPWVITYGVDYNPDSIVNLAETEVKIEEVLQPEQLIPGLC